MYDEFFEQHNMTMIRNPRALSTYSGKWSAHDIENWTNFLIDQVPYGINPLETETKHKGIFFI